MKYLSFSLWGSEPIYNIGTIRNAELSKFIYPEWKMVVFYDKTVPTDTIDTLKKIDVLTIDMSDKKIYGMFWRFFAVDFEDFEYAIFRDSDSRISLRERLAVDEWISSKKTLHIMRDHPAHKIPFGAKGLGILGGMWGIKKSNLKLIKLIEDFTMNKDLKYGSDQTFLQTIYNKFLDDNFTHDEFFEKKPFPIKRESGRFVGERIDINENPVGEDYKLVL